MEREPIENPNITLAKRVGRIATFMTAVYVGQKIGENLVGIDLPFFMEVGIAAGAATSADAAIIGKN